MDGEETAVENVDETGADKSPGELAAEFAASQEAASSDQPVVENQQDGGSNSTTAPAAVVEQSWENTPLPANHPGLAKGFKTWGDLDKQYASSSQEGHRLAETLSAAERRAQALEYLVKANLAKTQQPAAPKMDAEMLAKIAAEDPVKAIQMAALSNPDLLKPLIDQHLRPLQERLSQQDQRTQVEAFNRKMASDFAVLQSKYEPLKDPNTPEFKAADKFYGENQWVKDLAEAFPDVNAQEVAYKLSTWDMMAQKLRANDAKLVDKRSKSATVKPGTVAPASHAGSSAARAAAADLAARGEHIDEAMVAAMERELARLG